MSSAKPFSCDICHQQFQLEKNLFQHYFCIYRDEDELQEDGNLLYKFLPSTLVPDNSNINVIQGPAVRRYLPSFKDLQEFLRETPALSSHESEEREETLYSIGKFKEWVEDIKIHLIYSKYCSPEQKSIQIQALLDGLFDIQGLDRYVFNEGLFLLPELRDDKETFMWAFNRMVEQSLNRAVFTSQRSLLMNIALQCYEDWASKGCLAPEVTRLGNLLLEFVKTPSDSQIPNRLRELSVEVDSLESLVGDDNCPTPDLTTNTSSSVSTSNPSTKPSES